jgi:hypothetical protein
MKAAKAEPKNKRKMVFTVILNVVALFIAAQLSTFISNQLDVVGLKAAIIFFICAFVVNCAAKLIAEFLIPAVRKKRTKADNEQ